MKGLFWNSRGIKKNGVSSFLKDQILEHNFHFIALQETMVENIEDKILRKIDPKETYLWKWLPSRGKSGGILSGVNLEVLDVGSFHEEKYLLQLTLWDKQMKQKWDFINMYGAAHEENKLEFLTELARVCSGITIPYMLGVTST